MAQNQQTYEENTNTAQSTITSTLILKESKYISKQKTSDLLYQSNLAMMKIKKGSYYLMKVNIGLSPRTVPKKDTRLLKDALLQLTIAMVSLRVKARLSFLVLTQFMKGTL